MSIKDASSLQASSSFFHSSSLSFFSAASFISFVAASNATIASISSLSIASFCSSYFLVVSFSYVSSLAIIVSTASSFS
jgi:hypothetical protein